MTLQGYLGYEKPGAPTSVGPRFHKLRKRGKKTVGPRFLKLGKRTKAVGLRLLKFKKTDECGHTSRVRTRELPSCPKITEVAE